MLGHARHLMSERLPVLTNCCEGASCKFIEAVLGDRHFEVRLQASSSRRFTLMVSRCPRGQSKNGWHHSLEGHPTAVAMI